MKFEFLTVYKMEEKSMRTGSGKHTVRVFVLEKVGGLVISNRARQ